MKSMDFKEYEFRRKYIPFQDYEWSEVDSFDFIVKDQYNQDVKLHHCRYKAKLKDD